MHWKQTLAGGSATGVVLAILVSLIMIMGGLEPPSAEAVSYTHLTLPTKA